ncbi:MAG: GWxTD domain-containing protein [Bacteroidetes bacterium]|nr:GWxTD domain-containing protein [Bacteroidota bacterium]
MFKAILILCMAAMSATAQVEMQRPYTSSAAHFYFVMLNFESPGNKSRFDFYFQVPYSKLHFTRTDNEFASAFTVSIRLIDGDNNTAYEKSWDEKATSRAYDETTSENVLYSTQRHFLVNPGAYTARVAVTERETGESFEETKPVVARNYADGAPSMSDVMVLAGSSASGSRFVIIPNVKGNIISKADSFEVFYEIYPHGRDTLYATAGITGAKDRVLYARTSRITAADSVIRIFESVPKKSLQMGYYLLSIGLRSRDAADATVLDKTSSLIAIRYPELPPTITDLDKAADEMMFIAKSSTIDSIKSAPDAPTKLERFISFWKRYHSRFSPDGRTSMEEYYNRVAYANKQFTHFFEGWKSDRGMVYILFGSPDNVERHPFNVNSKPYEVWQYYSKNRQFIFVDDSGFGDYRLRNPILEDTSPVSGMDFTRE